MIQCFRSSLPSWPLTALQVAFSLFGYNVPECKVPIEVSELVLKTVLRVESKWLTNIKVLQKIIINYIALAEHRSLRSPHSSHSIEELHPLLLQSAILMNIEEYQTVYLDNEAIQQNLLCLCEQLARSGFHGFHFLSNSRGKRPSSAKAHF